MEINSIGLKSTKASRSDGATEGVAAQIELLKSDFTDLASKVAEAAKAKAEQVSSAATVRTDELRETIRKSPMQAALIATGLGFVLGLIVTR